MYRGNSSRIFPIVLVLIIVIIVVVAFVSIGRAIFGGNTTPVQTDIGHSALLNTSINHGVRMTVRGPIVANENFRSYQVTVNSTSRSLVTYSGYLDQVVDSRDYANSVKAYEEFVYALDKANTMQGDDLKDAANDTRGICAAGDLYEFAVLQDNNTVKRLWTSTCKGSSGSFKASVTQVQSLFLKQIPDSKTLLGKIAL